MVFADADDLDVPTARAGADPLIAFPKVATGETGQIERPGDQTPWWFVPGLCLVAVFFIGLLATINWDRASDCQAAEQAADAAMAAEGVADSSDQGETGVAADSGSVAESDPPTEAELRLAELPPAGIVSVDGVEFAIESRCEVQLPFDPADTEFQVSSYFFRDEEGERQLIDRIFDSEIERAQLLDDPLFVELVEIGDAGAFVATFEGLDGGEFEVVVNPGTATEPQCGDRVVTNEPGQFTEPHTRIILDVCVDRTTDAFATIVGLTSEGARFEILQAGGELAEIVFVARDGVEMRTAAPASIIRNGDITSASGVVSDGSNDFDITIDIGNDVTEAAARACVASDRF